MKTLTISLSDNLFDLLNEKSEIHSISANKLINNALSVYLEQLDKTEYVESYKRAAKDSNTLQVAEEGLNDLNALDY